MTATIWPMLQVSLQHYFNGAAQTGMLENVRCYKQSEEG